MSNDGLPDATDLPDAILDEVERQKLMTDGPGLIHTWWARRPSALARTATYLALTEGLQPDPEFLAELAKTPVPARTLATARSNVRDTQWRWLFRDQLAGVQGAEEFPRPGRPRVLDPFAGGGSMPAQAALLGCAAYASDLNPVSFYILRASLQFPSRYGGVDRSVAGNRPDGAWAGLADELTWWAGRVTSLTGPYVSALYPALDDRDPPTHYFWFRFVQCPNSACLGQFPLQSSFDLDRATGHPRSLEWQWSSATWRPVIEGPGGTGPRPPTRDPIICPLCGEQFSWRGTLHDRTQVLPPVLGGIHYDQNGGERFRAVQSADISEVAPWSPVLEERVNRLLEHKSLRDVIGPVTTQDAMSAQWSGQTYRDLLSARQLLVALEYSHAIRRSTEEMRSAGMPEDRVTALTTYLGFLLGFLVDNNTCLCGWNSRATAVITSTGRHSLRFLPVFVETRVDVVVSRWLTRITKAIQMCSTLPEVEAVDLADARRLPHSDAFFDAIVTDPPYFDAIPYTTLSQFFWVWERSVLADNTSELVGSGRQDAPEASSASRTEQYRDSLLAAFKESYRVLKPGRTFSMLLTPHTRTGFDEYVEVAGVAGFELVDVRRLRDRQQGQAVNEFNGIFLIYFRKPTGRTARTRLETETSSLLNAAEEGRPVLYGAFAGFLIDVLEEEEVQALIPAGAKGTKREVLMEVVAGEDPRQLLQDTFGSHGIRGLAKRLGVDPAAHGSPADAILSHFGFLLPSPTSEAGLSQTQDDLRMLRARVALSKDKAELRGPFQDACTAVERLIRLAVWAWAELIYGTDRDRILKDILQMHGRQTNLSLVPFGDVALLFRYLPDTIASSNHGEIVEQKLGRRHIYLPTRAPAKLSSTLDELVALRNKVAHDKGGYWSTSSLHVVKKDVEVAVENAQGLLVRLAESHAVPHLAVAIQMLTDRWGRKSYRFELDDQTVIEAYFSSPIELGSPYVYFGSGTNPRPVDPFVLRADRIESIP